MRSWMLCVALAVSCAVSVIRGADVVWTGASGASWGDASSWADGVVPSESDTAVFENPASGVTVKTGGITQPVGGIRLSSGAWILDGNTPLVLAPNGVVDMAKDGTLTLSCRINGSSWEKTGASTFILSNTNIFTGPLRISSGRVLADVDENLGSCPTEPTADNIILAGGALGNNAARSLSMSPYRGVRLEGAGYLFGRNDGDPALTIGGPISGNGDLFIINQTGSICLDAVNTYSGETVIGSYTWWPYVTASARLHLGVDGALPETTTLVMTNSSAQLFLNGTVQNIAGLRADNPAAAKLYGPGTLAFHGDTDQTISLQLMDNPTLTVTGAGESTLSFKSPSRGTFATDGNVLLSSANVLDGVTLRMNGGVLRVPAGVDRIDGAIHLTADTTLNVSGPLTLTGSVTAETDENGTPFSLTVVSDSPVRITAGSADHFTKISARLVLNEDGSLVLTNRVQLMSVQPSAPILAKGACVYGAGLSALVQGDQTIEGTNVCITGDFDFGTSAAVTLKNNAFVTLTPGNTGTYTAPYDFNLDETSVLQILDSGTVNMTGSVSGSGRIELASDGTLNLTGLDLSGFSGVIVTTSGGSLEVAEGETAAVSAKLSGTYVKTGTGTLTLTGTPTNCIWMTVSEGTLRLACTGAPILYQSTISAGATLVLDADEQINNTSCLTLNGSAVFDLNGHSETFGSFFIRTAEGRIVNRAESPAKLTWNQDSEVFGKILEEPGAITLRQTAGRLVGPISRENDIKVSAFEVAGGEEVQYSQFSYLQFTFHGARVAGQKIRIAEIILTKNGIPCSAQLVSKEWIDGKYVTVTGLVDKASSTYWQSSSTNAVIRLENVGYAPFDGYMICARGNNNDPIDWDVTAMRSDENWIPLDSKRGVTFSNPATGGFRVSTNFTFSLPPVCDGVFGKTAIKNDGLYRISSSGVTTLGPVTGSGRFRLEDASAVAASDLSGFKGKFYTYYGNVSRLENTEAEIRLNSLTGAAEQPVRIQNDNSADIAVKNATTNPVSVLLDDSYTFGNYVYGRFTDGAGPLGLVKRGSGTLTLGNGHGDYTGDTRIESGTLIVRASGTQAVTARYIRFTPSAYSGIDNNSAPWGCNKFCLRYGGSELSWPSGTTVSGAEFSPSMKANLIDNNLTTRFLSSTKNGNKDVSVTFVLPSPVTFDAYEFYSSGGNAADSARTPTAWTFEVSDDGTTWQRTDIRKDWKVTAPAGWDYSAKNAFSVGVFYAAGDPPVSGQAVLPAEFSAETDPHAVRTTSVKAQYIRFDPFQTYIVPTNPVMSYAFSGWSLSEFLLYTNGVIRTWPSEVSAWCKPDTTYTGFGADGLVDNITNKTSSRLFSIYLPNYVEINCKAPIVFDQFGYVEGPYNTCGRNPTGWKLYVSSDKASWTLIDARVNADKVPTVDYAVGGPWTIKPMFLSTTQASDALSDYSRLILADGAKLLFDTPFEKTGPVSGSGTAVLNDGAIWALNAFTNSVFSGVVSGSGTLEKGGNGEQSFASADLSGVTNLTLKAGVVSGDAVITGNLDVLFGDGLFDGTFEMTGALSVSGVPKFRVPENVTVPYRKTLFSAGSVDPESEQLLCAAEVSGTEELPNGVRANVSVSGGVCILKVMPQKSLLLIR